MAAGTETMPLNDACCLHSQLCCLRALMLATRFAKPSGARSIDASCMQGCEQKSATMPEYELRHPRVIHCYALSTVSASAVADLTMHSLILLQVQMVAKQWALRRSCFTSRIGWLAQSTFTTCCALPTGPDGGQAATPRS